MKLADSANIYRKQREWRNRMLRGSVAFIDKSTGLRLPAGFTLVGATSGSSKTTTSANIVAGALRETQKRVAVILNEEIAVDFWDRVASILAGVSFFEHRQNPNPAVEEVLNDVVLPRVLIYDGSTSPHNTATLEDVQDILELVEKHRADFSLVLLDYLQNITHSLERPEWQPWHISKNLGQTLKEYGRFIEMPVVVAAQLNPTSHQNKANSGEGADIRGRFQNDKHLFNHADTVIESRPNVAEKIGYYIVQKDRFGMMTGQTIRLHWRDGTLIPEGAL
jgi:replicative DNA helicase